MDTGQKTEVRNNLDTAFFKMQMNRIAVLSKSTIEESVLMGEYYKKFKGFTSKRFAEIVEHMVDNWHYARFPMPADFNDAIKATVKDTGYKPDPHRRDPNYGKGMQRVLWGFKQMDIIRRMEIPNCDSMPQVKVCYQIQDFWRNMVKEGKVFSVENKKWIDKNNAIGGKYFNPVEFGLGR